MDPLNGYIIIVENSHKYHHKKAKKIKRNNENKTPTHRNINEFLFWRLCVISIYNPITTDM